MPPSESSLVAAIDHYKRKLEKYSEDESVLLHCLNKLARLSGVSISVLQTTGVGRTVNALKKNDNEEVALKAKNLVQTWKQIVANEEDEQEDEAQQQEQEHGGHQEEEQEPVQEQEQEQAPPTPPPVEPEPSSSRKSHKNGKSASKKSKRKREEENNSDDEHRSSSKSKKHKKDKDRSKDKEHKKSASSSSSSHRDKKEADKKKESSSSSKKPSSSSSSKSSSSADPFDAALNGLEAFSDKATKKNKERMEKMSNGNGASAATSSSSTPSSSSAALGSSVPSGLTTNYRPMPKRPEAPASNGRATAAVDDAALSELIARTKSKGARTAVYSGVKRSTGFFGEVPTLKQFCLQLLKEYVDDIEQCGGLSYDVMEPVLERAQPTTLMRIEEYNPYLMEDTGPLWERFCKRHFPKGQREEFESFREMFERCTKEREEKLNRLKVKVKDSYKREENSHRKAKVAYVGAVAKPPSNVLRAQAKHGTALPVGKSFGSMSNPLRPNPAPVPSTSSSSSKKPRTAPMMAKTLKMAKGLKAGFRR